MKSRLFIQVALVMITGLVLFAVLVSVFWSRVFDARFNAAVDKLTSDVSVLLLPAAGVPDATQQAAIQRIAEGLSVNLTVYGPDGHLIGSSGPPVPLSLQPVTEGQWEELIDGTHWISRLADGRIVIADLSLLGFAGDSLAVTLVFGLLVLLVFSLMYPLVRRITVRLERLQNEVEAIGTGDLSRRVTVEGNDEIAKLAASFNASTETIEDLLNRQRMLLANASHELRTPLARIRIGLELLDTKDTPKRRAGLRQDIGELNALIDDLIAMARFDAGAAEICFEPLDLLTLVSEEVSRVEGGTVTGSHVEVSGDRRMLCHLIRNLLENAQKYGAPPIEVSVRTNENGVQLKVSDQGPGISPNEQQQVLEPFYRGVGKQNIQGSGLGLSLVARIAQMHGARVVIEDVPKSAVSIVFPRP
ncbi:HAMP domain-containing histidine kinase [Roseibium sp. RKSG952]|nr:HAMP domain-containing histidine kinase [Roseibium sp. RKSG952]